MLKVKLRDYQAEAVEKALQAYKKNFKGFLIGDKMGLGKTIQALAIADKLPKKYNSILVVAPTALIEKWRYEIKDKMSQERDYEFVFASYSDLADSQKRLAYASHNYDLAIFDEVHYAKNYRAKRTQGTLYSPYRIDPPPIAEKASYLLGLSGTWPPNSVADCYTWLRAIRSPLAQGGFEAFLQRHAQSVYRTPQGWLKYSGFKNAEEFQRQLKDVFIARDIDDVENEIPEGLRVFEYLRPEPKLIKEEQKIIEIFASMGVDYNEIAFAPELLETALKTFPDFSLLAKFRRLQAYAKFDAVKEYIKETVFEETKKVLLFCYHKEIAQSYYDTFRDEIYTVKIDGDTAAEKRFSIITEAKAKDECLLICTLDAVREGFDLVDFRYSIFAEIDWRPWVLEQAEGRTRRIGQSSKVRWIYFVFDVGVDAAIANAIASKKTVIDRVRRAGCA